MPKLANLVEVPVQNVIFWLYQSMVNYSVSMCYNSYQKK